MISQALRDMFFGLGRSYGLPTQYEPNPTAVTVDVFEIGWVTAYLIIIFAFVLANIPCRAQNLFVLIQVVVSLSIGLLLVLGNFGQEWEIGTVETRTPYKAGVAQEINASIAVKVGLRSVNVTLRSDNPQGELQHEKINYNERFSWEWDQGRFGFGPYAGHLQQEFRAAQYRGLPTPILWIVDYFVIDGEGFRFGRFYRTAGWYAHIALWCAFAIWLLSLILFRSVIRYGAYCLTTCGLLQLTAVFLWTVIRNPNDLVIPFEHGRIVMRYGLSYWLTFGSGIANILLSVILIFLDIKFDSHLYRFFGVNPLNIYSEVVYLTKEEERLLRQKNTPKSNDDEMLLCEINVRPPSDDEVEYVPVYLKRGSALSRQLRHSQALPPPPPVVSRSNKPKHLLSVPSTSTT